jgi:hypothetical protein
MKVVMVLVLVMVVLMMVVTVVSFVSYKLLQSYFNIDSHPGDGGLWWWW